MLVPGGAESVRLGIVSLPPSDAPIGLGDAERDPGAESKETPSSNRTPSLDGGSDVRLVVVLRRWPI